MFDGNEWVDMGARWGGIIAKLLSPAAGRAPAKLRTGAPPSANGMVSTHEDLIPSR